MLRRGTSEVEQLTAAVHAALVILQASSCRKRITVSQEERSLAQSRDTHVIAACTESAASHSTRQLRANVKICPKRQPRFAATGFDLFPVTLSIPKSVPKRAQRQLVARCPTTKERFAAAATQRSPKRSFYGPRNTRSSRSATEAAACWPSNPARPLPGPRRLWASRGTRRVPTLQESRTATRHSSAAVDLCSLLRAAVAAWIHQFSFRRARQSAGSCGALRRSSPWQPIAYESDIVCAVAEAKACSQRCTGHTALEKAQHCTLFSMFPLPARQLHVGS